MRTTIAIALLVLGACSGPVDPGDAGPRPMLDAGPCAADEIADCARALCVDCCGGVDELCEHQSPGHPWCTTCGREESINCRVDRGCPL